jgi:hypothetical protein
MTPEFASAHDKIMSLEPLSDEEVARWFLNLFQLEETYAISLGFETKPISGPYHVIKITEHGYVNLR